MTQEEIENQALQAELAYRQQPIELNPKILHNILKKTGLKPDQPVKKRSPVPRFSSFLWEWRFGLSFATSVLLAVVVLFQVMPPEPVPRQKDFVITPELVASNPQETAHTLKAELKQLGIVATVKAIDDGWIVEVENLSTDRPDALSDWLKKHQLILLPKGGGLKVLVVAE